MNEKKIIQIATNTKSIGLNNKLPLKAKAKNKICGDEILVEVSKNIDEIRYETNSCILTQASAALLAKNIKDINDYGLKNFLELINKKLNGAKIKLPFEDSDLELILNQDNKKRKECIALPFNAVIKAIND